MDENRVKEIIKDVFESMTDEQKEKVKSCKTKDELVGFLNENIELPEELLKEVAGGGFGGGTHKSEMTGWERMVDRMGTAVFYKGPYLGINWEDAYRGYW